MQNLLLMARGMRARDGEPPPGAVARQIADLRAELARLKAERPMESSRG